MEEKFLVLAILHSKRGFLDPSNVSGSDKKYHHKHSSSGKPATSSLQETKNVLELPKTTFNIIQSLENLNVGDTTDPRLDLPALKEGKKSQKTCNNMESNDGNISTKNNNVENVKTLHSSKTNHSSNGLLFDLNGSKEKTETFKDGSLQHGKLETGKGILNTLNSDVREFNSFEEFDSSESEEHQNEVILNTLIVKKNIPVTVQEWINNLPSKTVGNFGVITNSLIGEEQDIQQTSAEDSTALLPAKLSREASLQSSSSLDSLLDSRRPDPVEIFLNLGFGGLPGVDTEKCRIPNRFLVPSKCKGGDWNEFLRRELIQAQNFECSSLGFRGLSGPSYRRPSPIVANIMDKLRERTLSQSYNRSKSLRISKKESNEKNSQDKLSPEFQSVLSLDSRKFLQNQGKISPEVPRRRIIFGQKSFAFARNGDFVEVESAAKKTVDSESEVVPVALPSTTGKEKTEASATENPKLRRGSLQKQKKVEEDFDMDAVFTGTTDGGTADEDERVDTSDANEVRSLDSTNKCRKESGEIPRRFLSTINLKSLDGANSLSDIMRREVEKEILSLSHKIKNMSDHQLVSVLRQVKQMSSALEKSPHTSFEV